MINSKTDISIVEAKTQKLRTQAAQILPSVTTALIDLGYYELCHQRISQQLLNDETTVKNTIYQGLTRACHLQYKYVMIKWWLSCDSDDSVSNLNSSSFHNVNNEAIVLRALKSSRQCQGNDSSIAPALLNSHLSRLQVLSSTYQLTVLVMPYYKNGNLANYLRQHKTLSDKQKYQLILQSAYLIAHLHQYGWLHNDIKPSNILLEDFVPNNADNSKVVPRLLLTDFALAQRCEDISCHKPPGTPAYLAPERWQGQGAALQSDIYAFGIMMMEILTGNRPFRVSGQKGRHIATEWAIAHCQQPIPKLPEAYQQYQDIINNVLAKRYEKRYKCMDEVIADLK